MKKKFSVHAAREVEQIGKDFVVKAWEDMGEVELDAELNDTESAFDAVKDNGWFEDGVKSEDIEIAADDDHNLYIDEAETGIPMIELRIVVDAAKKDYPEGVYAIYDNGGKTIDRYAVYYSDKEEGSKYWPMRGMDEDPTSPQGYGIYSEGLPGAHNGKEINFSELPEKCQKVILSDLKEMTGEEKVEAKSALKVAAELLSVKAEKKERVIDAAEVLRNMPEKYDDKETVEVIEAFLNMYPEVEADGDGHGQWYNLDIDEKNTMDANVYYDEDKGSWFVTIYPVVNGHCDTSEIIAHAELFFKEDDDYMEVEAKAKTKTEGDMKGTLKDIKAKANGKPEDKNIKVKAAAGPLTILNEMKAKLAKLDDAVSKEHFLSTNKRGVFSAPGFDYIMGGKASDAIVDAWSDYANGKIKDEEVIEKVKTNIDAAIAEISKKYGDKTVEQIRNRTEAKLKVKADELPATDRYGTPEIGGAPANDADEVIADGVEPKPAEAPAAEPKPEEKKTEVSTEGGDVNVEIPGEKGMSAIVTIQKALREATNQKAISTEVIQQLNKILKEAGLTATGKVQAMKINAAAKDKAVKTIQAAELFYNTKIANFEVSDLCGEKTKKRAKELKAIIASKLEQATDGFLPVIEGKAGDERMAVTSSLDVIASAMKEWQAFEESHGEYAESMLKVEATMNCLQELGDNNAITASEVGLKFKDYFDMTDKERRTIKAHVISRAQEVSGLSVAKIPLSMTSEETVAAIREKRLTAAKTELGEAMIRVERAEGKIPQEKVLEV